MSGQSDCDLRSDHSGPLKLLVLAWRLRYNSLPEKKGSRKLSSLIKRA